MTSRKYLAREQVVDSASLSGFAFVHNELAGIGQSLGWPWQSAALPRCVRQHGEL